MFTGFGRVEYCDAARTCQGGVMWDLASGHNAQWGLRSSLVRAPELFVTFAPWCNTRQSEMIPRVVELGPSSSHSRRTAVISQPGVEPREREFPLMQVGNPAVAAAVPEASRASSAQSSFFPSRDSSVQSSFFERPLQDDKEPLEAEKQAALERLLQVTVPVHLISTPYSVRVGFDKARETKEDNHNPPHSYCYNPNTDSPQDAGGGWLQSWIKVCKRTKQTNGTVN